MKVGVCRALLVNLATLSTLGIDVFGELKPQLGQVGMTVEIVANCSCPCSAELERPSAWAERKRAASS
jgi:GTP cyclohydrolase FolE2